MALAPEATDSLGRIRAGLVDLAKRCREPVKLVAAPRSEQQKIDEWLELAERMPASREVRRALTSRLLDVEQGLHGLIDYERARDVHNPGRHVVDRTDVVRHLRELVEEAVHHIDNLLAPRTQQLRRHTSVFLTVPLARPDDRNQSA